MPRLSATIHGCLLAIAVVLTAMPARAAGEPPRVRIAQGLLQGVHEDGIEVFRGIPFAGDTGGEHRWRPPTAPPAWRGIRDASRAGPICPQSTQARAGVRAPWLELFRISEDCLNLSVYRPARATGGRPLPVMVWVHGGFARIGTGSRHDGKDLARDGVIVVTLNYRLDRLGLFAHPAITAEQPDAPLGNYALLDVLAGLRWVRDNIARFGGDPRNVTLFGQSSGGVAVTALMGAPSAEGLFHRAIAQSGVMADLDRIRLLRHDLPGAPSLESDGVAMAGALLPKDGPASAAALRALPWEAIIGYSDTQPAGALVPVVDGQLLTGSVMRRFAEGRHLSMPFMVGTTSWEQSLFVRFNLPLAAVLGPVSPAQARNAYPGLDDAQLSAQWLADTGFHAPARFLADANAATGQPTWVYRFDHVPQAQPDQPGAAHSDDVPYLFAPLALPHTAPRPGAEADLARTLRRYWTDFARSGDPNATGLPGWPRWQPGGSAKVQLLDIPVRSAADPRAQTMQYHLQRLRRSTAAAP